MRCPISTSCFTMSWWATTQGFMTHKLPASWFSSNVSVKRLPLKGIQSLSIASQCTGKYASISLSLPFSIAWHAPPRKARTWPNLVCEFGVYLDVSIFGNEHEHVHSRSTSLFKNHGNKETYLSCAYGCKRTHSSLDLTNPPPTCLLTTWPTYLYEAQVGPTLGRSLVCTLSMTILSARDKSVRQSRLAAPNFSCR